MERIYDSQAFLRQSASETEAEIGIVGFGRSPHFSQEAIALACDTRIPASAQGYVADMVSGSATVAVVIDRIHMLSRYVQFS